jgi:hypothetical protein
MKVAERHTFYIQYNFLQQHRQYEYTSEHIYILDICAFDYFCVFSSSLASATGCTIRTTGFLDFVHRP